MTLDRPFDEAIEIVTARPCNVTFEKVPVGALVDAGKIMPMGD